jgi:hypothetical protein
MKNKVFNCVDKFYQVKNTWGVEFGRDCAYRALEVQNQKGFDIGYGTLIVKKSLVKDAYVAENSIKGYCVPYAWHVWCEDEDNVYDSCGALTEFGVDVSSIKSVVMIEAPIVITNMKIWRKYLFNTINKLHKQGFPDVVYIQGAAEDNYHFLGDKEFNVLLDNIDGEFNITGTTQNNIVEFVK